MTNAVARQSVAAGNLANIDTPGFRTRDVTFASALEGELANGVQPTQTNDRHLAGIGGDRGEPQTVEAANLPSKRDGNNVQLDRELLALNHAAGDFSAAQTALSAKFRLVRYAINEGR